MSVFANPITTAVVLAAGRGTRMRRPSDAGGLTAEQERAAADGLKAMMPVGRPFLDYALSALADAGITDVCIVVRPDDARIRARYSTIPMRRLRVRFAEQAHARGTADALLAAMHSAGNAPFLMLNSDNYYPAHVVRALVDARAPALGAFDAGALVKDGNIPAERVRAFALIRADADGYLTQIVEKPDDAALAVFGAHAPVSMNLWVFPPEIFTACERVARSVRGEFELADAVGIAMHELGVRFRAVPCVSRVLDLSARTDIPFVAAALRDIDVQL